MDKVVMVYSGNSHIKFKGVGEVKAPGDILRMDAAMVTNLGPDRRFHALDPKDPDQGAVAHDLETGDLALYVEATDAPDNRQPILIQAVVAAEDGGPRLGADGRPPAGDIRHTFLDVRKAGQNAPPAPAPAPAEPFAEDPDVEEDLAEAEDLEG